MTNRSRFLPSLMLVAASFFACADQQEGERCEIASGDTDCDSGLKCVDRRILMDQTLGDRCCPLEELMTLSSDRRCLRRVASIVDSDGQGAGGATSSVLSGGAGGETTSDGSTAGAAGAPAATAGSSGAMNDVADAGAAGLAVMTAGTGGIG
ncbi:hypothetical protein ACFL5O_00780 [Myxococcota bacterium]